MYSKDEIKVWTLQDLIGLTVEIREFLSYENNMSIVYACDVDSGTMYILETKSIEY